MPGDHIELDERFEGNTLDTKVWFPYYLPHWSSPEESAATWFIRDGELHLLIPADQPLWCPVLHDEPPGLRSPDRQLCRTGRLDDWPATVHGRADGEGAATDVWGYTPHFGQIEVRMRGTLTPRSMFGFWLAGLEDRPERSGEILVAEVFGARSRTARPPSGWGSVVSATRR